MSAYVLTCSAIGGEYAVAPVESGSSANVLVASTSSSSPVVATCISPAFVPYAPPLQFTESDFLTLAPAILLLFATVYGARTLIRFAGGRR